MSLSRETVAALAPCVRQPIPLGGRQRRIVHLGIGAFSRAHQAIYTQDAENADDGWRITGVSLRSPQVRDMLLPQDGLYTVTERANGTESTRLVTVVDEVIVAGDDPDAVITALAAPDTHVVTITVTEKGYYRHPSTGRLLTDDPAIRSDLRGDVPRTIYGFLAAGLKWRRAAGSGGLTLISCDNLSGNGRLLMALFEEFLERLEPGLARWTRMNVVAPNTMVDRIVPAATAQDRAAVAAVIGVDDAAALVTEPYRQWVIEDRFAGPRPRWEAGGAQIVEDVAPFELAKLRLLNGSHSTLAYAGLQLGHEYVHQAVADPTLRTFVTAQMRTEAAPCLPPAAGLDIEGYIGAILERFANSALHHRLDQIAMDGSQKLPQRWIATIVERLNKGLDSPLHLHSLAAWVSYTAAAPQIAGDPLAADYARIWAEGAPDVSRIVERYATDLGILPPELRDHAPSLGALVAAVRKWRQDGPRNTLDAATRGIAV